MTIKLQHISLILATLFLTAFAQAEIHTGQLPDSIVVAQDESWIYKLPKKKASLEFSVKLKENDNFHIIFSGNRNFSSEILRVIISDTDCNAEHKLFATYSQSNKKNTTIFKYMDQKTPWNHDQIIRISWIEGNGFTITRNNESISLDIFKRPGFIKFNSYGSNVTLTENKIIFAD